MSNVDINVDRRTDGQTDGRKMGRLCCTLLQAGAIKRVITLILLNIVPSWDIEGRKLASFDIPKLGQYSPISVQESYNILHMRGL